MSRAQAAGGELYVWDWSGQRNAVLISTMCVGWQSLVLFALSSFIGLRGRFAMESKVQVVVIGVLGTILINLLRMTVLCIVAADFGFWPAVIVHDYGGTLVVVIWLFAFWAFAHRWILRDETSGLAA